MQGKVDLFANHKVILTPLPSSADWAVEKLIQLWSAAKAEVICMDVEKHDEVLAHTSHLPHLMAFNLVEQLANREDNLDIFVMLRVVFVISHGLQPVILKCGMTFFCQ
jgi:3-phosphoshikimate 1-carboxyvinyltransferase